MSINQTTTVHSPEEEMIRGHCLDLCFGVNMSRHRGLVGVLGDVPCGRRSSTVCIQHAVNRMGIRPLPTMRSKELVVFFEIDCAWDTALADDPVNTLIVVSNANLGLWEGVMPPSESTLHQREFSLGIRQFWKLVMERDGIVVNDITQKYDVCRLLFSIDL